MHLDHVKSTILKLQLPDFDYTESEDWSAACSDVWDYVNKITINDGKNAQLFSGSDQFSVTQILYKFNVIDSLCKKCIN